MFVYLFVISLDSFQKGFPLVFNSANLTAYFLKTLGYYSIELGNLNTFRVPRWSLKFF